MKDYILITLFSLFFHFSSAQELLCNVSVNSSQVQISDRKLFQTMQTEIYEFVNNTN